MTWLVLKVPVASNRVGMLPSMAARPSYVLSAIKTGDLSDAKVWGITLLSAMTRKMVLDWKSDSDMSSPDIMGAIGDDQLD